MKSKTAFLFRDQWRRLLAVVAAVTMFATLAPIGAVSSAESDDGGTVSTGYTVKINETVSNGFTHPGVGVTKANLENMRTQVLAQKEPWYSYYKAMTVSSSASKTVTSSNQSSTDPTKPAVTAFESQGFNQRFIADGLKAYTQALMYYITGDEVYRANAMHIIRIWSQMDPAQFQYFNDAHIHTGIPLNRMVTAAEILKYSSYQSEELKWTDKDTADFTNNLITPAIDTFMHENNHFMNQHNYPLLGAMAGYIFTENRERYNEAVEWATVNKTASNQGFNGSIKQLFRLVDTNAATGEILDKPVVQHVEMGRDQAHGAGDLTNSAILSRMFLAQGTKVDPVEGTVSTQDNAVGYYEFLDDRFLAAADFFGQYMLGYDTPWVPVPYSTYPDGTVRGIYQKFSDSYRGRTNTALFWEMYYYYTYVKGINVAEKAPYFYEAFAKRIPSNYYYQGEFKQAWESVDGGGDFWIYIPKEAESEGAEFLPKEQPSAALVEIEDRYTVFDNNTVNVQEGDTSYLQTLATAEGSQYVVQNLSYANRANSRLIGLKIRTNGPAALELSKDIGTKPCHTLTLPDTKGQWKYVTYDMGISKVSFGRLDSDYSLLYMNVKGAGTTVDIDHINVKAGEQLTPPVFNAGNSDLNIFAFAGAPVNLDFSAADSNPADVIAYEIANKPQGAQFNAGTGAFSWQPTQAGTYSFIVEAFDGITLATRNVNIVVSGDRVSAVAAATSLYIPYTSYVSASLNHFNGVYDETMSRIETASDEAFYQQLVILRKAAVGLQLLTPLLQSEGMDYTNIVTSTFGNAISLLVDGNDNTYPIYTLALYPNLYHILDFGADYKITANAFAFEGRMNFTDRMAGITVFGSNDGDNWTRITSGQTPFVDDMATLHVDDAYKNEKFRLIKMEMIDPQPDVLRGNIQNILELSEFRIYGQRHEIGNKLESVSISSDQSVNGRIVLGNTAKLTIKAKETINNVTVKIQGQDATVSTQDNINWTAAAALNENVQTGPVKFSIDYKENDGTAGDTAYFTTENSKLYLADESDLIHNVTSITKLIDSTTGSGRTAAETLKQVNYLFDNNLSTNSDFRLNGGGSGSYITFDFKEGNQVALSSVELLARQDTFYTRIRGAVVQGSNDNTTWTTLSKAASSTAEWQTLSVNDPASYRYIRIYNPNGWFGNMAELRFHGVVKALSKIDSASLSSDQSLKRRIVPGNTVKLTIKSKEAINNVKVAIQGQDATVSTQDNINFTAVATLNQGAATGPVKFTINYKQQDGADGFPITTTSDDSKLYLADESDLIRNVTSIANLIDSTTGSGRTAADTLKQVNYLFDGNVSTNSDFRLNGTGTGSYIAFDFKGGNQATLSSVELLARQDNNLHTRIVGTVVQGSDDNTTWATLTTAAVTSADWQSFAVSSKVPYRYIRIYNPLTWFGNMTELRLHGVVKAADQTAPVTTDDAPQGWVNTDTKVSFHAVDPDSGVAATYYTVDGGAQQTGNAVTLTAEGTHTLMYWSVDFAGNVEAAHIAVISIDKTAPVSIASTSPAVPDGSNGWYTSDVTLSLDVYDNLSGLEKTEYQVNNESWIIFTGSIPAIGDGIYTVNYRSTDQAGNVGEIQTIKFKIDTTAPVLTVERDKITIWPPNHKLETITAEVNGSDSLSGIESIVLTSITSNEPDQGTYAEDQPSDIQDTEFGTLDNSFSLRAERLDEGTGRVYTITYTVTDVAGNTAEVSVTVTVPHDQSE